MAPTPVTASLEQWGREHVPVLSFRRSLRSQGAAGDVTLTLRALRSDGRLRALSDNFIDLGLDLDERSAGPLINRLLPATIVHATKDDTTARLA